MIPPDAVGRSGVAGEQQPLAMIVCGALAREVAEIVDRRGWQADIHGISADHHLYPDRIVEAVEEKLVDLEGRYRKIIVVYGDCGTAGMLDRVLARHKAVRPHGPHCYAMLAGCIISCGARHSQQIWTNQSASG